jgi:hypothetical protein
MAGVRYAVVVIVVMMLAALGSVVPASAASSVCKPTDNPANCEAVFAANQNLAIKSGVPFVWLRKSPSSSAEVAYAVNYSAKTRFVIDYWPSVYDGYQNWWLVRLVSDKSKGGWVEQSSLVDATAPDNTPAKANWSTNFAGGIRAGVPFVWVRNAPNSSAGVLFTLLPGDPFIVLVDPQPIYDGRQWWWTITSPVPTSPKNGYVEQASIVPRVDAPPTLVPTQPGTVDTAQPTCDTMTVRPATFKQGDTSQAGGIYYVAPGSTITFDVEGLANLASITFNVPGPNDTLWRTSTSPRKLDFPGVKAEVTAVVPQQYGWVNVSAEAVGLNGETIQCGAFFVDNSTGEHTTPDTNVPAVTPEL